MLGIIYEDTRESFLSHVSVLTETLWSIKLVYLYWKRLAT